MAVKFAEMSVCTISKTKGRVNIGSSTSTCTSCASLHRSSQQAQSLHSPVTPSPSKTRPLQVRSASPRYAAVEERCGHTAQTPTLRSNYHHYSGGGLHQQSRGMTSAVPNYMAATESAKEEIVVPCPRPIMVQARAMEII